MSIIFFLLCSFSPLQTSAISYSLISVLSLFQTFTGNRDANSIQRNEVPLPAVATSVMIMEMVSHNNFALRMELYGCAPGKYYRETKTFRRKDQHLNKRSFLRSAQLIPGWYPCYCVSVTSKHVSQSKFSKKVIIANTCAYWMELNIFSFLVGYLFSRSISFYSTDRIYFNSDSAVFVLFCFAFSKIINIGI